MYLVAQRRQELSLPGVLVVLMSAVICGVPTAWAAEPPGKEPGNDQTKAGQADGNRQACDLTSSPLVGVVLDTAVELEVGGNLKLSGKERIEQVPMSVVAHFAYQERPLAAHAETDAVVCAARFYEQAEAAIKAGPTGSKRTLRDQRRLIVASLLDGNCTFFCPSGLMTRDELDLVAVVGNTLVLERLLPGKTVHVGQSWEHDAKTIAALLGLDAASDCQVHSELTGVTDEVARISMAGTVRGAAEGVSTEIELKAKYHFHLKERRITGFNLSVSESRAIGHVAPGLSVVAKLKVTRRPVEESQPLTDEAVADLSPQPAQGQTWLEHQSEQGGVRFACDRRWYITADEPELTVLRLIDRGDLVAQCNISPVAPRDFDKRITLAEYQNEVKRSLAKRFGKFVKAAEWTDAAGQAVYGVTAVGLVEELPIEWHYYLLAHPSGRRIAVAITVEAPLAERLGQLDRQLVSTIELVDSGPTPAAKPDPQPVAARNEQGTNDADSPKR